MALANDLPHAVRLYISSNYWSVLMFACNSKFSIFISAGMWTNTDEIIKVKITINCRFYLWNCIWCVWSHFAPTSLLCSLQNLPGLHLVCLRSPCDDIAPVRPDSHHHPTYQVSTITHHDHLRCSHLLSFSIPFHSTWCLVHLSSSGTSCPCNRPEKRASPVCRCEFGGLYLICCGIWGILFTAVLVYYPLLW